MFKMGIFRMKKSRDEKFDNLYVEYVNYSLIVLKNKIT